MENLRRAVPFGTVGGRIAGAIIPLFLRNVLRFSAFSSLSIRQGTICVVELSVEKPSVCNPVLKESAMERSCFPESGLARIKRIAAIL